MIVFVFTTQLEAADMRNGVTEAELIEKATGERVTLASIEAAIVGEHYFTALQGARMAGLDFMIDSSGLLPQPLDPQLGLLTICTLTLWNGWIILGKSACADPKNYNEELGRRLARTDAVNQIWPLMGFELKCRLANEEKLLSWSPKEVFERAYRPVRQGATATASAEGSGTASVEKEEEPKKETWVGRLVIEHSEVSARFEKLDAFIPTEEMNSLPAVDRQDLHNQHMHMEGYKSALERRMARHKLREDASTREAQQKARAELEKKADC